MGEYLSVDQAINRDGSGNLLPEVTEVEYWPGEEKPKIKYVPISSGEWKKLFSEGRETSKEEDKNLIVDHCKDPQFTEESLEDVSVAKRQAIYIAITALTRVLTVDIKTMEWEKILVLSAAILILAIAGTFVSRKNPLFNYGKKNNQQELGAD